MPQEASQDASIIGACLSFPLRGNLFLPDPFDAADNESALLRVRAIGGKSQYAPLPYGANLRAFDEKSEKGHRRKSA
jgi:hypothetical protein